MKLRTSLDVETVATTLALAEQHHCPLLKDACVTFMSSSRKVLGDVVATQGFKHLTASIPLENLKERLGMVSLGGCLDSARSNPTKSGLAKILADDSATVGSPARGRKF
jgi:speckle-type POZ protein